MKAQREACVAALSECEKAPDVEGLDRYLAIRAATVTVKPPEPQK